jgi:hypothetical protein
MARPVARALTAHIAGDMLSFSRYSAFTISLNKARDSGRELRRNLNC